MATRPDAASFGTRGLVQGVLADRGARLGLLVLFVLVCGAVAGFVLDRFGLLDSDLVRLPDKLRPPLSRANSFELEAQELPLFGVYLLGTDEFGRSLLARSLAGATVSLSVGLLSMAIAGTVGLLLGALAGFFGERRIGPFTLDGVVMSVADALSCFPTLFIALTVLALLPSGTTTLVLVIGLTSFMAPARLVRAEVLALRARDHVQAARALGVSEIRIAQRHVLPAVVGPLLVSTTLGVGFAVLTESALSFLGFGIQPPRATWGNILGGARPYLFDAPWLFLAPGFAIFALVLSAHLVGDALRRELERRARSETPQA